TWQCVKNLGPDVGFVDVAFDPKSPDVLYAASYERRRRAWDFKEGGPGSRLWKSTDGGDSWKELGGGLPGGELGRIGLDVYARDPRIVYASIENLNPKVTPPPTPPTGDEADAANRREPEPTAEQLADPAFVAALAQGGEEDEAVQDPVRAQRRPTMG